MARPAWFLLAVWIVACGDEEAPPRARAQLIIPDSSVGPCTADTDCRVYRGDPRCGCDCHAILASAPDPRCDAPRGEAGCYGNACALKRVVCEPSTRRCALRD
jgi:hypothetical protein